jgi:hypothetical protein
MMQIYTLLRIGPIQHGEVIRFEVRACAELRAREMAAQRAGAEGPEAWLDAVRSSCRGVVDMEQILDREQI